MDGKRKMYDMRAVRHFFILKTLAKLNIDTIKKHGKQLSLITEFH